MGVTLDPGQLAALFSNAACSPDDYFATPALSSHVGSLLNIAHTGTLIALVKGDPGSGKTSLLQQVEARLNGRPKVRVIRISCRPDNGLISELIEALQPTVEQDEPSLSKQVIRYLTHLRADGSSIVLLLDDAQYLQPDDLLLITRLGLSPNPERGGLLHVLLFARAEVEQCFASIHSPLPLYRFFTLVLSPFTEEQTGHYLRMHLAASEIPLEFTQREVAAIHKRGNGLPGAINRAAIECLQKRQQRFPSIPRLAWLTVGSAALLVTGVTGWELWNDWPLSNPATMVAAPPKTATVPLALPPANNSTAGSTTAGSATAASTTAGSTTAGNTTAGSTTAGSTTAGSTTAGSTTAGSTTAGNTTAGNTTAASTTTGNTTAGNTTAGNTTAGNTTAGNTTAGNTTAGNTTAGNTTAASTTAGSTTAGNTTAGNTTAGNTTAGNTTAGNTTAGNTTAASATAASATAASATAASATAASATAASTMAGSSTHAGTQEPPEVTVTAPEQLLLEPKLSESLSTPPRPKVNPVASATPPSIKPPTITPPVTVATRKPEPSPTPSASKPSAGPPLSASRPDWLLRRPASEFMIQLLASDEENLLRNFIKQNPLPNTPTLLRTQRQGQTWYVLLLGPYTDQRQAQSALERLPSNLRKHKPWLRSVADVRQSLP